VVASIVEGGTYEDPTTGGPLSGAALVSNIEALYVGFPDLHFDIESIAPTGEASAVARWTMRGTNTGPMPGGPATGGTIALGGVDLIDYDPDGDRLTKVVGFFDTATLLRQLGLKAHITPGDTEPFARYGISLRIDSTRETIPGAFSVTWMDIDPEYQSALIEASHAVAMEQLGNDGYLGTCFAIIGRRNYTFTAWASLEAARSALRGGAHGAAMHMARAGGLGDNAFGVTSLWKPDVLNGVFRPGPGPSGDLAELTGQWL
jgi:steroid delta-isomerase-like uncharacterized protein